MAKIKYKNTIIEIKSDKSGKIVGEVVSAEETPEDEIALLNQNLQSLCRAYVPVAGSYAISASNAIASWIANGLGAEVLSYDKVEQRPDEIY